MLKSIILIALLTVLSGCGISYTEKEVQLYTSYCNEHNMSIKLYHEGFTGSVTGMQCIDQADQDLIDISKIQRK